jgi:hypothetical protein
MHAEPPLVHHMLAKVMTHHHPQGPGTCPPTTQRHTPQFATLTRGAGLMHRAFLEYRAYAGPLDRIRRGALVSMAGAMPCC